MAAWSKAWVCAHSLAAKEVSVVCCHVEVSATARSLVQRDARLCVCLIVCDVENNEAP